MFGHARKCLEGRPLLWGAAAACAVLAALPGTFVAVALATPLTALALSADPVLVGSLLPGPLGAGWAGWWSWALLALVVGAGTALWARIYAVAVHQTGETVEGSSWTATRTSWKTVLLLQVHAWLALIAIVAVVTVGLVALSVVATETATLLGLAAALAILVFRILLRIVWSLAVRAAVFDGATSRAAWSLGRARLKETSRDAAAAWVALLAAGVTVWLTGRFVSPILQDTALQFPPGSRFNLAREAAHLVMSIPLETLLLALGISLWSAVWIQPETDLEPRPSRAQWLARVLAGIAALIFVANGVPLLAESAWEEDRDRRRELVADDEISPEDALESAIVRAGNVPLLYEVEADVSRTDLEWKTTIRYRNETGESLTDLGIHVYPAAFTGEIEELPLAGDLLSTGAAGRIRAGARPGTLDVENVAVDGDDEVAWDLKGTALTVDLERPLEPERQTEIVIELAAELPQWPERYGTWEDTTLLGNWIPSVAVRQSGEWRLDDYGGVGDPFLAETAFYDVTITARDRLGVVGTGTLLELEEGADVSTWRFVDPDARDAAYALGRFLRGQEHTAAGTTVRSWYHASETLAGRRAVEDAVSATETFTSMFGTLPGSEEVEIVLTDGFLGGMEYPGVVFVSQGFPELEGLPVLPELVGYSGFERTRSRYVTGHEVAHQWWYSTVGNDPVREPWLDEAFAEMSTRLWLRDLEGDDHTWSMTYLASDADPVDGSVSARATDYDENEEYVEDVYIGGAEVLLELRERIGPRAFEETFKRWYGDQLGSIGTIEQFADLLRVTSGEEGLAFLERWRD